MMSTFRGHRIPHVDFMGRKKWWFALSGFFIVLSIVGLFVRGLNFSLDFKGGTLLTFSEANRASVADLQGTLARYGLRDTKVEILGSNQVQIKSKSLTILGTRADQLRAEQRSTHHVRGVARLRREDARLQISDGDEN